MKFVMNCLDEEQTIVVGGKHFHFKANQIKQFYQDTFANIILREKAEYGFVEIPLVGAGTEDDNSGVASTDKVLIDAKRKEGIENYCNRLRNLVYNAQVSLQKDLDIKGIKISYQAIASDGDLKNMEKLAKYQSKREDANQVRVDRIKQLEKQLEKNST